MRRKGSSSFIIKYIFYFSFALPSSLLAQEPIEFEKHNWIKNTMSGHVWQIEYPIETGYVMTGDYDYESTGTPGVFYFGGGIKFGLKNNVNRGFAIGPGLDWTNNKYLRLNLFIDLDFLYQFKTDMGNGKNFSASMFTKFVISKVLANVEGTQIQEYYFRYNVMQFQIQRIAFSMNYTKGLFRNKYPPHFADKGLNFEIAYIFKK
jgi:hypothetical protein